MSLYTKSNSHRVPSDPTAWEKFILNQQQQAAQSRRTKTVRCYTVEGIPTFEEFKAGYEQRHGRKICVNTADARTKSRDSSPGITTDDSFGSKRSSQHSSFNTTHQKHHYGSFKASSFKFSPYSSPKRAHRRFNPSGDRCGSPMGPNDSFADSVRRDKARFAQQQTSQHHARRSNRSRPSAMPKLEQFFTTPPSNPPLKHSSYKSVDSTTDFYHQWRSECDAQLHDKTIMTNIPTPPTPICGNCQQAALMDRTEPEVACIHSLDSLFRGATKGPGSDSADSKAYYKILKEERNKWHTDRFSMCQAEFRPDIERTAKLLFVLTNELFGREKKRLDDISISKVTKKMPASPPTGDFFADPNVHFW